MKLGTALMCGIAAVALAIFLLTRVDLDPEQDRRVTAWFEEVGQVKRGAVVRLRGQPIGHVSAVSLGARSTGVRVEMRLDPAVPLPDDPVVLLSRASLLGPWQAEILPRERFPYFDYAHPPEPAMIPGHSLADFSRIVAVGDRFAEDLTSLSERAKASLTAETARDVQRASERMERFTATLSREVEENAVYLEGGAADFHATALRIREGAAAVGDLLASMEASTSAAELDSLVRRIRDLTGQIEVLTRVLASEIQEVGAAMASADTALDRLNSGFRSALAGDGRAGSLLSDTTALAELLRANAALQSVLADLQENPRR